MKWLTGMIAGLVALLAALAFGLSRVGRERGSSPTWKTRRRQKQITKQVIRLVKVQKKKDQIRTKLKQDLEKSGNMMEARELLLEAQKALDE